MKILVEFRDDIDWNISRTMTGEKDPLATWGFTRESCLRAVSKRWWATTLPCSPPPTSPAFMRGFAEGEAFRLGKL